MAELRAWRTWSRDELAARLAGLAALGRTCPEGPLDALRVEDGWRSERSEATIAREPPGPPVRGGAFDRARDALAAFAFSDPTIVAAHSPPVPSKSVSASPAARRTTRIA